MKTQFKTFVKPDRSEFVGVQDGIVYTSGPPINIIGSDATILDIEKVLYFKDEGEREAFFDENILIDVSIEENIPMPTDLFKRRGMVTITRFWMKSNDYLKEFSTFFQSFFPYAIQAEHETLNNTSKYYGFSPLFRPIDEAEKSPEYMIWFKYDEKDNVVIDRVEEIKS